MSTQNLQQEFSKRQETFLAHTKNPSLLEGETEHFDVFFQTPAVKDLIAFGAEHNEFLTQIVDTFSSIGSMESMGTAGAAQAQKNRAVNIPQALLA